MTSMESDTPAITANVTIAPRTKFTVGPFEKGRAKAGSSASLPEACRLLMPQCLCHECCHGRK
jgi:hypothetical protein